MEQISVSHVSLVSGALCTSCCFSSVQQCFTYTCAYIIAVWSSGSVHLIKWWRWSEDSSVPLSAHRALILPPTRESMAMQKLRIIYNSHHLCSASSSAKLN